LRTNESEWTDGLGMPSPRPDIRRILCLKLDHIGDLLVADLALRLLRKFFPGSHVTLICGEWNADLARQLELAEVVIGISLFHPRGADQHDIETAARARSAGIKRLTEVAASQPEFDLAIDLRIDEDTRDLLKLFKARVYAGSGDLVKYPFLDISLPLSQTHPNQGPKSFRLSASDFTELNGYEVSSRGVGFAPASTAFRLKLLIDGACSPAECGTNRIDKRRLGIGLQTVSLVVRDARNELHVTREFVFRQGSADCRCLVQGWSGPEPWGTWSVADEAILQLSCADSILEGELSLVLRFQAHVNPQNKVVTVTATDPSTNTPVTARCEFPPREFEMSIPFPHGHAGAFARSRAVFLRAGTHRLSVDILAINEAVESSLKVSLQGSRPLRTIASRELLRKPGQAARGSVQFDFTHRDSDESLHVLLESGSAGASAGLHVHSVVTRPLCTAPARIPAGHMEKLIARLVTAAALEFSPFFLDLARAPEVRFREVIETSRQSAAQRLTDCRRLLADKKHSFKIVGLSIAATKETKRWPFGYMLELCELLLGRPDVYLVLLGGPADVEDTERLEKALEHGDRVLNFCGKTALTEFAPIVSEVDLYIGYDTGPTHYAGRIGVRTIGIFAAVHSPREWGPVGRRASWITHYTDCSPCYLAKLDECRFGHACMLDLLPVECWRVISSELDAARAVG
jgi:ADP-heptose:LPS heptosyltransferase